MSASKRNAFSCLLALGLSLGAESVLSAPAAPAAPAASKSTPAATAPAPAAIAAAKPASAATAGPGDPVAIIRKKDAELQKLLRDKTAKTDRIKALINGIFDFEELGRKALGPELWKSMSADQQKRFVKAFREMVENSSVKKLEAYQSDSTAYEPADIRDSKATVTSHVFSKGQESIVTYKLLIKEGEWKAWDLVIDDLSTAGNYGDQFKKILQTSNIEGLIARLEKKAAGGDGKPVSSRAPADNVKAKSEKAASSPPAAQDAAKKTPAKVAPATPAAPAKAPGAQGSAVPVKQDSAAKVAAKPAATSVKPVASGTTAPKP